ncbi:MAG: Na+/H+ antiporter NhaC family protein, partial [Arenibacter latericius]|nr:Na+/H+ antiporter NhaC family protein [Arenibacter latericius]
MQNNSTSPSGPDNEHIVENKELNLWEALIPVIALIGMLAYNVFVFGDDALSGSNQFILLMGGAVAAVVGIFNKVSYEKMFSEVAENVKSTTGALLILLMVGALSGTWLISGIIPTMIYYGLLILNPTIFLAACVIICAVISVATGSSWTTSATVGIALIGIGTTLGIPLGMTGGAILSGAYFGDKMSPLSDTTNLAPAMAGTDLFSHIRYMTLTTVPTISVTILVFIILGLTIDTSGIADTQGIMNSIEKSFNINGWLFLVPIVVIALILKKAPPLLALLIGTLLGAVFALIFQPEIVMGLSGASTLTLESGYKGVMNAITAQTNIASENAILSDLFSSKGMAGMLGTIWLILCAMVFGGIMDGIGALSRISSALLSIAKSTFSLFASTVASCLA